MNTLTYYVDNLCMDVVYTQSIHQYQNDDCMTETLVETWLNHAWISVLGSNVDVLPMLSDKQKVRLVKLVNNHISIP